MVFLGYAIAAAVFYAVVYKTTPVLEEAPILFVVKGDNKSEQAIAA